MQEKMKTILMTWNRLWKERLARKRVEDATVKEYAGT